MKRTICFLLVFTFMTLMSLLISSCGCNHEWETVPRVEATCTKAGNTEYRKCTICGENEGYQILYALEHSYEGTTDGTCIRCDAGVKFILPTTPKNISCTSRYYNYKTCKIESIKIERKQKPITPTYELTFMVQSTYHEKGSNYSDSACFNWKLYDEDGVVVCSGTEYTQGLIMVGEKSKVVIDFHEGGDYFNSLETGKTYRLELTNID